MIRSACAFLASSLALCLSGCGGSSSDAKSPDGESSGESSSSSGDSSDPEAGESGALDVPKGPDCSDGTCFGCGDGICPKGAYCDQNAGGGAACAWLPECTGAPTCSCITEVLKGCSCDEASGAPLVSCQ